MFHQAENKGNIEDITFIVETTDKNSRRWTSVICMSLHNGLSLRCLYWLVTSDAPLPTHTQFVVVS